MKRISIFVMSITLYASMLILGNINYGEASDFEMIAENKRAIILGQKVEDPVDCYINNNTGDVICQLSGPVFNDEAGFREMIEMMIEAEAYAIEENSSCPAEPEPSNTEESSPAESEDPPPETANATSSSSTQGECTNDNNGAFCKLELCFTGYISPHFGFPSEFTGAIGKCSTLSSQQISEFSAVNLFGSPSQNLLNIKLQSPPGMRPTSGTMMRVILRYPQPFKENECTLTNPNAVGDLKCNQNPICPIDRPKCMYVSDYWDYQEGKWVMGCECKEEGYTEDI